MTHNRANTEFECDTCKESKPLVEMCAAFTNDDGLKTAWCADCWDNDPRAMHRYQTMSLTPGRWFTSSRWSGLEF